MLGLKKPSFVAASWLTGMVVLSGCGGGTPTTPSIQPPSVQCVIAGQQTITDYDQFVGRTEATETVGVQARVSGFLQTVEFDDGQYVERDQLLATIEPDEYQAIHAQSKARVQLAKAKQEFARASFERAKKLLQSSAVSREEYDEKASAVKQSVAEIVVAQSDADRTALDVKYTEIRAPIAGRIDRAFVTPGNMVTGGLGAGTLLTRIVNTSPMYANFDVDEATILRYLRQAKVDPENATKPTLKELQIPCFLQLQDETGYPRQGVLDFVETGVDRQTGTQRVRGVFENADRLLQDGMYVNVRIPAGDPYAAVLIPEIAIGTDQSYKFAFVVDDAGIAQRRTLTLGKSRGPLRIITQGVSAGETVIVQGVQRVRPGMKVDVQMQSPPPTNDAATVSPSDSKPNPTAAESEGQT